MRVSVLVLDGVFDSGLSVVLDTLATANNLARQSRRARPFEVTLAGVRRSAKTAQGLRVALSPAHATKRPDLVVLPALGCKTRETLLAALERRDVHDACALLQAWSMAGVRIAGACTATFVLAQSGVLDGGRTTTTWWLSPLFRERFPHIALDESRMIVETPRVITAGAALAHVDLALWLVRRRSPELAHAVAHYLVFDARPSQAAHAMPDHLVHDDPTVARFEQWTRTHLGDFDLGRAARHVGTSERTLERRIRAVLGKTPVSYLQDLRVEAAVHRLRTTKDTVDQIAATVGYADAVTLRTLLRKKTGRGVRELRALG